MVISDFTNIQEYSVWGRSGLAFLAHERRVPPVTNLTRWAERFGKRRQSGMQ